MFFLCIQRSWSKTPSPPRGTRVQAGACKRDRSPLSPALNIRSGPAYATHMERSRAALEQLVEEDRTRRAAKEAGRHGIGADQSPPGFYSPGKRLSHARPNVRSLMRIFS
ncbi:hypothetical protein AHF37_12183 [Paragonimus kellicotti]|nr:hypothetical protein AHF37_12183 [Paragonimus kellicotti]